MVLMSNEWINNDDEQKSTAPTTATESTASATGNGTTATDRPANVETTENGIADRVETTLTTTPIVISQTTNETIATNEIIATETVISINRNHITSTQPIEVNDNRNSENSEQTQHQQQQQQIKNSNKLIMDVKKAEEEKEDENGETHEKHENETNESDDGGDTTAYSTDDVISGDVSDSDDVEDNNNVEFANMLSAMNSSDSSNTNTLQNFDRLGVRLAPQSLNIALNSASQPISSVPPLSTAALSSVGMGAGVGGALQQQQQQMQTANAKTIPFNALEAQTNLVNSHVPSQPADIHKNSNSADNNGDAKIVLMCETNSHPFQTRIITLTPNIECKVGRLIAKSKANEGNAIFDCKVLSRNHAVLWYTDDGKFWVKDTKSSNGTFINENKLGNEAAELHFGDVVKFGVDVMENSRKEVHGCIIASVRLYLPDGREAVSIDAKSQSSLQTGEGRISFDEIHRLNAFVQETAQREKLLKTKLSSIQNVLDSTRKNSAQCWQSMITEDQLLHKIHSLEKKLQVMEKNVPESVLRNEILKLLDDKTSYQQTAKESLRKVYQERCEATEMLAKMEAAYTAAVNESTILRDQAICTKQILQDVNERLIQLEREYNEFKDESARQQQEAKEMEEQHLVTLMEKLKQSDIECDELRAKITELSMETRNNAVSENIEDEEKLVLEKLDAAIAYNDIGEDDDDDDDDEEGDVNDAVVNDYQEALHIKVASDKKMKKSKSDETEKNLKQKVVRKSTVMKWLQNSDLNKGEGSADLFKAIFNQSDSSEEHERNSPDSDAGAGAKSSLEGNNNIGNIIIDAADYQKKCANFTSKLANVQINLQQLEAEIANETNKSEETIEKLNDGAEIVNYDSDDENDDDDNDEKIGDDDGAEKVTDEFIMRRDANKRQRHGKKSYTIVSKDMKSYNLLKSSVDMLREAFNEICEQKEKVLESPAAQLLAISTQTPAISVHTQFQNYAQQQKSSSTDVKMLETQDSQTSQMMLQTVDEDHEEIDAIVDENASIINTIQTTGTDDCDLNAIHTIEMLQTECDQWKQKVSEQAKLIETLNEERQALEQEIATKLAINNSNVVDVDINTANNADECQEQFERQMRAELAESMSSCLVEREEELITYKERLEQTENSNQQLRMEITELKMKTKSSSQVFIRRALPFGAVALAAIVYFLFARF